MSCNVLTEACILQLVFGSMLWKSTYSLLRPSTFQKVTRWKSKLLPLLQTGSEPLLSKTSSGPRGDRDLYLYCDWMLTVFFYLFNSTFIWIIIIRDKMECFHVHLGGSFYRDFSLCHGKSGYWLPFQYLKLLKLKYTSNYLEFVHR